MVRFIAVAGVGTKQADEWTDDTGNMWMTGIQAPGIGLFSYDHDIGRSDLAMWRNLLDHGQRLLQAVITLVENQQLHHCPIILAAHSLGGLIVKEALRQAYERTARQYRSLKKSLAGVILMGTPHSIPGEGGKWQMMTLFPQIAGFTSKAQPLDQNNIQRLIESCLLFDQSGVVCPILTICETQQTKLKQRFGSKRVMLVNKGFATTGSQEERVIEVDSDHRDLCNVADPLLTNFITEILEDARLRIGSDSPLFELDVDELDEHDYDMADSSSNPNTSLDPRTNAATEGSSEFGFEMLVPAVSQVQLNIPVLPCYLIPVARNKDFFGRSDIFDQINEFLPSAVTLGGRNHELSKSFALCGPGGIGKTQIVTEYVYRSQEAKAFDAIFWIHADEDVKLSEGIAQIATSLDLVAPDSSEALDPVITTNLVKEWLSNPSKSVRIADDQSQAQPRWLLVLDNVDDTQVMKRFWPIEGPGCVLITSRDPLAKEPTVLADAGCDVDVLNPDESSAMLSRLTKRTGDGRAVGDRLGGLPLAIVQMASVIIRNHMSFDEFVETWDERKEHPEYFGADSSLDAPDTYDKSLSTVWAIDSLRHGKPLLDIMAFYDPDSIQESILKQYSAAVLEHYPTKHGDYHKARTELLQTSLIRKDATEKNLNVHRIVQDATRSKMHGAHYNSVFSAALHLLVAVWPFEDFGWRHGVARWRKCDELFPHVLRLRGFGSPIANNLTLETKLDYCKLMNDAGWFYHETGHFTESQAFIKQAYEVAITAQALLSIVPSDDSSVRNATEELTAIIAETHHNLGCIGSENNQPEFTLFHFKSFNVMMIEQFNEAKPDTIKRLAISWNELGNAFMMNRRWVDGEDCFKQCLEVAQRMVSFSPADFSFPYVNLGLSYWLTDRFDHAKEILEEGLRYRFVKYGYDDSQSFITGRFLYALGNVAYSQGALDDSFRYHKRALHQFLLTIGRYHHRTGDIRVKLAQHYLRMGHADKASEQINEALATFQAHATLKPELARAKFWKSKILGAANNTDEARRLQGESLNMYLDISCNTSSGNDELSPADFDNLLTFWSR